MDTEELTLLKRIDRYINLMMGGSLTLVQLVIILQVVKTTWN